MHLERSLLNCKMEVFQVFIDCLKYSVCCSSSGRAVVTGRPEVVGYYSLINVYSIECIKLRDRLPFFIKKGFNFPLVYYIQMA